ncbi:Carbon monoxide dehydrogenase subunit G [Streptomyces sp. 1222.5]|uniref:SRPBCC domain-containing protein n=1 Tax=unclassified Streptomyces TaxID=2593676 RepID=UPI000895D080|nr:MULTISPECIES: SRPBCC domain-containing protein [unclassified Streptomyces]PKW08991.1 carbon monoxide dehydrogenase subunit G [Streptomyces sp. 5112.2]SEC47597.1 Carbon monoxide dehydrogenase subunit G [Streptomyces sp. 1222.5]
MEHQVFVPVPADRLRAALADPVRVARAVPGLQQDAGAEPVAGRLKVRVGGHSVTYRGAVRVSRRADGTYAAEGEATEARGAGTVKLALTLRLADTDGGTTVTVEGTADADGRIAELPADAVGSAVTRLLNRFVEALADADLPQAPEGEAEPEPRSPSAQEPPAPSVFDIEVPPPSLDPEATEGEDAADRLAEDFADTGEPPAEAAHARRTMIGRSAEEVDHAPPRGRYAPVPAPQTVGGSTVLRWAAPAAAVALASAIVVGRALRRRR